MRIIITVFCLLTFFPCFSQHKDTSVVMVNACWGRKSVDTNALTKTRESSMGCGVQKIRMNCGRTSNLSSQPLIVVNGEIIKSNLLSTINMENIEKIEVIKGSAATALFGAEGTYGALLIRTRLTYKKLTIKDAVDKMPVPAATVSFNFGGREHSLNYIADEKGVILSNSWKELAACEMTVSAVGYNSISFKIPGDVEEIFLQRDMKTCGEAVLVASGLTRCSCCGCCGNTRCIQKIKDEHTDIRPAQSMAINVYPNPVERGAHITVQCNEPDSIRVIQVLNLDGRILLQQPLAGIQKNVLPVETDPRWAAGIYFVQVLYENGRVAASEKIFIR